jgi:hypothetical protein
MKLTIPHHSLPKTISNCRRSNHCELQLREQLQVKNVVLEKKQSGNTSSRSNKLSDV